MIDPPPGSLLFFFFPLHFWDTILHILMMHILYRCRYERADWKFDLPASSSRESADSNTREGALEQCNCDCN